MNSEHYTQKADIALLYSSAEIKSQITRIASNIALDHKDCNDIILIALLKGSFVFAADLIRELHTEQCHPQIDFMTLSSYGNKTTSSGEVKIHSDINVDIAGKNVILIDDILESGRTMRYATDHLMQKGAATISSCVLLDKPSNRLENIDITPNYVGFEIEDKFVVGYGLDYANYYRELPYIGVLKQ